MTPERRARDLAISLPLMGLGSTQAIQAVASAVRKAVGEEREAIAAMVESYAALIPDHGALPVNGREAAIQAANEIAAAIRARGQE